MLTERLAPMSVARCAAARISNSSRGECCVDDLALPGMLYLAILRSPHAHARVTGIGLSAARAADGT
jgi:CO/xanthine dehydrogenase Mo-binding subunit